MAELEKEGLNQTMHENRDEDEPHYTDDSKTSKIQDDASFEEKLIEEVRRYNNLYNTSLKDYKDFTITSNSWKEIAQTLRVEEQVCRTKWKKLRDRYVRLRRKIKGKSGGAASGIQTQILTTLSWLSGFIKHKETKSDYPQEEMDTSEDLQDDNLIEWEHFHSSNNEQQDGHLAVRRNVILERTKFNQRQQEAGETADDFISALHCLSEHCGYGALLSEMIRDRLVAGLLDRRLSKQLQMDPELTLDKAVTRIRQTEIVEKQQDLQENIFKAASSTENEDRVLSCRKHQCPANVQCQSEKNQNSERPQQHQTMQKNAEDPLDTDDTDGFSTGGEKPHYCAYCGRSFQKVRDLIRHQRTHTGEKPHHCPDCDRSFARLDKLKIHQEIHIGVKPHNCPDCNRRFARLDKLKSHQKIHAKDKHIFHSSDCAKSFVLLEKLEKHQLDNTFKATSSASNVDRVLTQQRTFSKVRESKRQQSKIRARAPGKRTPTHSKKMQEKEEEPLDTDDSDEWIEGFSPGGEKPHYCFDCGKSFRKVRDLIRHQRTHTGEKPHHCPDCEQSFARLDRLKSHQLTHTGVKAHQCPDCDKSYSQSYHLKRHHQRKHMKGKYFHCNHCEELFSRPKDLKTHMHVHAGEKAYLQQETHTGKKPYHCSEINQCSDCGKSFRQVGDLKRHQRTHTGEKPYHCPDCDRGFGRLDRLKSHQLTHTGVKAHQCPDCDKSYSQSYHLKRHRQRKHMKGKFFHCNICDELFSKPEDLKTHTYVHAGENAYLPQDTHAGKKPYHCSRCDKRFPDMAKLRSHLPVHTGDLALHCSDCGKCFLNKAKFERHQRTHTGSVLYLCTDCGEGFTNMQQLERHQRMHTGEKPYHCTDCGKSFALEKTFKCHKQAHKFKLSGERAAYPCSECGNTFSRSCDVMTHVRRVHNKERPFQCSCCGKRFFQKNSLTIHMRSHTGEKPYHCSDCGQSFSQINDRKRHQKRQHSGEETTPILQSEKKCHRDTQ